MAKKSNKSTKPIECEACAFWKGDPEGKGEMFCYILNAFVWDVYKAHQIITASPRDAVPLGDENVSEVLKFGYVNDVHAMHLTEQQRDTPGIAGKLFYQTKDLELITGSVLLDGRHRAKRCKEDGVPFKVFVLTLEESNDCLLQHLNGVPPKIKNKRATKKKKGS